MHACMYVYAYTCIYIYMPVVSFVSWFIVSNSHTDPFIHAFLHAVIRAFIVVMYTNRDRCHMLNDAAFCIAAVMVMLVTAEGL